MGGWERKLTWIGTGGVFLVPSCVSSVGVSYRTKYRDIMDLYGEYVVFDWG